MRTTASSVKGMLDVPWEHLRLKVMTISAISNFGPRCLNDARPVAKKQLPVSPREVRGYYCEQWVGAGVEMAGGQTEAV